MSQLLPKQFLFRFAFACPRLAKAKKEHLPPVKMPRGARLPYFGLMDGRPQHFDVSVAWCESGLAVEWSTVFKTKPVAEDAEQPHRGDGLTLWLDARDTRAVHRATRFCTQWVLLPSGGDAVQGGGRAVQRPIGRALEEAPRADPAAVRFHIMSIDEDGAESPARPGRPLRSYRAQAFLPAAVLPGFDPQVNRRLGFFCRIRDDELGEQLVTGSPELPFWEDPSLWPVLELVD